MATNSELHVFENDHDAVVAESAEDATALLIEMTGYDPSEVGEWRRIDDGEPYTIQHVDEPGCPKDTRTAAEWVAFNGRGPLASTEY